MKKNIITLMTSIASLTIATTAMAQAIPGGLGGGGGGSGSSQRDIRYADICNSNGVNFIAINRMVLPAVVTEITPYFDMNAISELNRGMGSTRTECYSRTLQRAQGAGPMTPFTTTYNPAVGIVNGRKVCISSIERIYISVGLLPDGNINYDVSYTVNCGTVDTRAYGTPTIGASPAPGAGSGAAIGGVATGGTGGTGGSATGGTGSAGGSITGGTGGGIGGAAAGGIGGSGSPTAPGGSITPAAPVAPTLPAGFGRPTLPPGKELPVLAPPPGGKF